MPANVPTGPGAAGGPNASMQATQAADAAAAATARQVEAQQDMLVSMADQFNPFSADRRTARKGMSERRFTVTAKDQVPEQRKIKSPDEASAAAQQKERDNPELPSERLLALRDQILKQMGSPEEILEAVLAEFPEHSLADEALDYLIDTTGGEIAYRLAEAKELLRARFGRLVAGGRNVAQESRTFAQKGIGSPSELRSLYLGVTGDPKSHNAMFEKLASEYEYEQLKDVAEFLLKSLGADLKSEGPSIERGKLYWLVTEVRSLQSILGVFNFFLGRENLVDAQFEELGLEKPTKLNFELMAKQFMKLVEERYPSSLKVLRMARELGLEDELLGQTIVYAQFRDGVRGVSPRIYRSMKQRYELLLAIMEALDELEERLEELEEENGEI